MNGSATSYFAEGNRDLLQLARPDHAERMPRIDLEPAERCEEPVQTPHGVAVDSHDGIALQESSLISRTTPLHRDDEEPTLLPKLVRQGVAEPDGLGAHAEIGAADTTVGAQAFGDPLGGVHGERAADAAPKVPAVDTDHPALRIDERTA